MKDLATGEIIGEPLPHEEWLAEQREVEEQDAKDREARRTKRPASPARRAADLEAKARRHENTRPPLQGNRAL